MLQVLAGERPVDGQVVAGVCSSNLHGVSAQASVQKPWKRCAGNGVRRLLVIGDDGQAVVGCCRWTTLGVLADELAALAGTLKSGLARGRWRGARQALSAGAKRRPNETPRPDEPRGWEGGAGERSRTPTFSLRMSCSTN